MGEEKVIVWGLFILSWTLKAAKLCTVVVVVFKKYKLSVKKRK